MWLSRPILNKVVRLARKRRQATAVTAAELIRERVEEIELEESAARESRPQAAVA